MRFFMLVVTVIISVAVGSGCTRNGDKTMTVQKSNALKNTPSKSVHGGAGGNAKKSGEEYGMIAVVKKQHLENYKNISVGQAIDGYRYFKKKEWSESQNANGTYFVDFTGWIETNNMDAKSIKEGVVVRGLQIKFVIYSSGSFGVAMVSRMEAKTDGKIYAYPLDNINEIIGNVYANKELSF